MNDVTALEFPVWVVSDDDQPVDVIIERSFTESPYITYRKVKNKLTFENLDLNNKMDLTSKNQLNTQQQASIW